MRHLDGDAGPGWALVVEPWVRISATFHLPDSVSPCWRGLFALLSAGRVGGRSVLSGSSPAATTDLSPVFFSLLDVCPCSQWGKLCQHRSSNGVARVRSDATTARARERPGQEHDLRSDGVLLTGVTGFLGMELLARYLERTDRTVYALVRGADARDATARLERTLLSLFGAGHPYGRRVVALRGDITSSGLGLRGKRDRVAEHVSEIVHSAASVSFELGLEATRAINVEGTRRVLELARHCDARGGLRRFSHVSTAYVAGEHAGRFNEDDLAVGQRFRNAYEQSKFEAELLVGGYSDRLPITVLRPSIIVGERDSGWTASFNVLYWPLRAFSRGAYRLLPAHGDAPVDVVPVDYVADAIFELSRAPEAEGATYHLTASANASSVGELIALACARFGRPAPRLIAPGVYHGMVHPLLVRASRDERQRRALTRSEVFFPYFAISAVYDDRRARVALRGTGIAPTPLPLYFDRLVEFALAAEWGRRPIPRASVAGSATAFPYGRMGQVRRPGTRGARQRPRRSPQRPSGRPRSALR
jgi:thioester reductase-like protein